MIKIIEDGMEYVMECKNQDSCEGCELNKVRGGCHEGSQQASFLCGSVSRSRDGMRFICTSAQKVTEEAKVYGPHQKKESSYLIGEAIEFWDGEWVRGVLGEITALEIYEPYMIIGKGEYSTIRKATTRHLTFTQIKSLHPDLGDVVLIEEEDND